MPRVDAQPFRVIPQPSGRQGQSVLSVTGSITTTTAPAFQEAVASASALRLIIDMTAVPSIDSMAIGALVRVFVSCNKAGRKLALVGVNHRVQNTLRITGVEALFDTYATVPEAEASLG
jgi:anti-sigma B factor antagonist